MMVTAETDEALKEVNYDHEERRQPGVSHAIGLERVKIKVLDLNL